MIKNLLRPLRQRLFFCCVGVFVFGSPVAVFAESKTAQIGSVGPAFVLPDADGNSFSLKQKTASAKLVVLAFLGTECPLAKHYSGRLQEISERFEPDGLQVVGLMPNSQDSAAEIAQFREQHSLTFPILKDGRNFAADAYRAERTPEVVLLDEAGVIRYRGRIDDQFQIGTILPEPRQRDLENAIEAVLAGKQPAVRQTDPIGCVIGRRKASPATQSKVTYHNQISRIFQNRCNDCHRTGQAAPFVLTDYDSARGWAGMIEEVVRTERMPPWHADPEIGEFKNACDLPAEEKELIYAWVAAGAPQGDPADAPEPKSYPTDWMIAEQPDSVFQITPEPVAIQAKGEVKYQYYKVDTNFEEDKWIAGAEIRPGNYAVVHHILVFARERGKRGLGGAEEGGFLAAYVPGLIPERYPTGMGKRIPAGAELIFQVHYTPIGSAQEDQSEIGFVFADPAEITHEVVTHSANQRNFVIPPHASNHEVVGYSSRSDSELQLLALMPHMHLRGKAFRYELQTPDGELKPLLSVPKYDFNWQTAYRLAEPMMIPAGSRIKGIAHFDNSADNPFNPAPDATVRWGDQTWEEMMIGYFDVAVPIEKNSENAFGTRAEQLISRLDENNDGELTTKEVPPRWLPIFFVVDINKNGIVTLEELEYSMKNRKR